MKVKSLDKNKISYIEVLDGQRPSRSALLDVVWKTIVLKPNFLDTLRFIQRILSEL